MVTSKYLCWLALGLGLMTAAGCRFLRPNKYPPRPLDQDEQAVFEGVTDSELKRDLYAVAEEVNLDAPVLKDCMYRAALGVTADNARTAWAYFRGCEKGCDEDKWRADERGFGSYTEKYQQFCKQKASETHEEALLLPFRERIAELDEATTPAEMALAARLARDELDKATRELGREHLEVAKLTDSYNDFFNLNRVHLNKVYDFYERPDIVAITTNIEVLQSNIRGLRSGYPNYFRDLNLMNAQLHAQEGMLHERQVEAGLFESVKADKAVDEE